MPKDNAERPSLRPLPRRTVLRGGLAGLAAAMMAPVMNACDGDDTMDASTGDAGSMGDAGPPDAGPMDAGQNGTHFPERTIPAPAPLRSLIADIGDLGEADANEVRLPPGFSSRIVARTGQLVEGTSYEWHLNPDGGATFATEDGGWIYTSNSEVPLIGGVGAIRFSSAGAITAAYPILERTLVNCAGGHTPWHTWLSCEEVAGGQVYECDPWGEVAALVRPALGTFKHEAVAVDPVSNHLYLTEDEGDGLFYRFVPDQLNARGFPDLSSGTLECAVVDGSNNVTWVAIPDPTRSEGTATRRQVASATPFDGGEGIWYHDGIITFSSKGDNHVRAYDVAAATLAVIYDGSGALTGVDNVTGSAGGDILVAEDGGDMEIQVILPDGSLKPVIQVVNQSGSEITGPAFDPSGTRLYFSSQRGGEGGLTFEVTGPFHEPV
ncbi:MAG: alkaline phosphatase PhoX [Sandaracinaceae bacterium]